MFYYLICGNNIIIFNADFSISIFIKSKLVGREYSHKPNLASLVNEFYFIFITNILAVYILKSTPM